MGVTVRAFQASDVDAFRSLHRACLAYYDIKAATRAEEDRVLSLLQEERHMACHIAFDGHEPVGFATWGLSFPAGAGISLVMKELFVSSTVRNKGVGKALLSALVDVARHEGCTRFDWATDGSNAGAQRFYAGIGAPGLQKHNYRVPEAEFSNFQRRLLKN